MGYAVQGNRKPLKGIVLLLTKSDRGDWPIEVSVVSRQLTAKPAI